MAEQDRLRLEAEEKEGKRRRREAADRATVILSEEEESESVGIFWKMDADHDGRVDMEELQMALGGLMKADEVYNMMSVLDQDKTGGVSLDEWKGYLATKKEEKGVERFGRFLRYCKKAVRNAVASQTSSAGRNPQARATADRRAHLDRLYYAEEAKKEQQEATPQKVEEQLGADLELVEQHFKGET